MRHYVDYVLNASGVPISGATVDVRVANASPGSGALTANTIGTASAGVITINAKAATVIQYQTVNYASTAAGMTYALHIKISAL